MSSIVGTIQQRFSGEIAADLRHRGWYPRTAKITTESTTYGVMRQFGADRRGCPFGSGSESATSNTA